MNKRILIAATFALTAGVSLSALAAEAVTAAPTQQTVAADDNSQSSSTDQSAPAPQTGK